MIAFNVGDSVYVKAITDTCEVTKVYPKNLTSPENRYEVRSSYGKLFVISESDLIPTLTLANSVAAKNVFTASSGIFTVPPGYSIMNSLIPYSTEFKEGDIVEFTERASSAIPYTSRLLIKEVQDEMLVCTMMLDDSVLYFVEKDHVKLVNRNQTQKDNSSHRCSWKNYMGLSYQEEYCDCGQTKNRRGLFE